MSIHIWGKTRRYSRNYFTSRRSFTGKIYCRKFFREHCVCYNEIRNMLGFTGTYKGKRISVQGTGMGIPSISIYATELMKDYNVQNLVRVGTCGAIQKDVKIRDVILAMSASTDSQMNRKNLWNYGLCTYSQF